MISEFPDGVKLSPLGSKFLYCLQELVLNLLLRIWDVQ